jgi:CBS-domain-containing membrane protein
MSMAKVGPVGERADYALTEKALAEITAGDVMSAPVVAVSVRDDLWTAWTALYQGGFRHLVVLDGSRCVGIVDDRRIVLEWPLGELRANNLTVGDVMRKRLRCIQSDTPVAQIARIMLDEHTDAVPVVSRRGEIVGLVTASDLLTALAASGVPTTAD